MNMNPYNPGASAPQYNFPTSGTGVPGYAPGAGATTGQFPGGAGMGGGIGGGMPGYSPSGVPGFAPSGVPGGPSIGGGQVGGVPVSPSTPGMLPVEESFIENILRLNLGKMATIYMTFENNSEWNAKIFRGVLEAAGRDHIIISDPKTGVRYLLLMVNLDYVTFDEELQYTYPYPYR
ncbi:spore coat protein GerQ [Paenibacillus flagellatus]